MWGIINLWLLQVLIIRYRVQPYVSMIRNVKSFYMIIHTIILDDSLELICLAENETKISEHKVTLF